jgi:uncharacterized protein Yka (UPF0111/DUF47 family)
MKFHVFGVIFIIIMLIASCAKPPEAEMAAAKAAVDSAKSVEADRYVPDVFNQAKTKLNAGLAEVDKKNYEEAAKLLVDATATAKAAADAVPGKKEEMKKETESLMAQVPDAVENARKAWKKAPRGKGTRETLQMIKDEISAQEAAVAQVQQSLDSGDILTAKQKVQAILGKLASITQELQP